MSDGLLHWRACTGVMRSARITEHPTDMTVARNDPVTLKCSADGIPAPTIEWYRDGELIISSNSNGHKSGGNSHRVMLPGGDLFFFRVVHGRKESDAGVYWCLARNPQGSSRSRNATLTVACKSFLSLSFVFQFIFCLLLSFGLVGQLPYFNDTMGNAGTVCFVCFFLFRPSLAHLSAVWDGYYYFSRWCTSCSFS